MSSFLFLALIFFFLSCRAKNLFLVSMMYFLGITSLSPDLDLGWRSFFLSWVYISGIFVLIVYVSTFSSREKEKTVGSFFIFMFLPLSYFFCSPGNTLLYFYFFENVNFFLFILFFILSLLPLLSILLGTTISGRTTLY